MSKVTLYLNVPPYVTADGHFWCATSVPIPGAPPDGWKRVAIIVDLPFKLIDEEREGETVELDSASAPTKGGDAL